MAAVEDLDAPIYEPIELGQVIEEDADGSSLQHAKDGRKPYAVSSSIRAMTRLLYSGRKCFSSLRGSGWLLLWNMVKGLVLLASVKLPPALVFLMQILLPLLLAQLHTLWVHTVITPPSSKPFRGRIIAARTTFKAVALPMLLALVAEATTQRILWHVYKSMGMGWEDFFPMVGAEGKALKFWLLLAVLVSFLIVPTHLLLVRVEASLLPTDADTIVPLDPAFAVGQSARGHLTLTGAWTSFTRASRVNLGLLYVRIFFITAISVAAIGFVDFTWYILMALRTWQF